MKIFDRNNGNVLFEVMTNQSKTIDEWLDFMGYGVNEDGQIYDTDTNETVDFWYDDLDAE